MGFIKDQFKNGIKKEVLALDLNHNGKPDVIEALRKVDDGLDAIAGILSYFSRDDFERFLNALNNMSGQKMPKPQLNTYATALGQLAPALELLDKQVEAGITALDK